MYSTICVKEGIRRYCIGFTRLRLASRRLGLGVLPLSIDFINGIVTGNWQTGTPLELQVLPCKVSSLRVFATPTCAGRRVEARLTRSAKSNQIRNNGIIMNAGRSVRSVFSRALALNANILFSAPNSHRIRF